MIDSLTKNLLDMLADQGTALARELLEKGIQLVRDRVDGRASDDAVMAWLREAQGGAA